MDTTNESKPVLLVVDDEPEIREIIAFCAKDIGFTILEAGDGAQALEIIRKNQVDVVCSDLMMPRVSGITLLTHMRDEGRSQPFILLTAYPSQDSTIQALRLGAFDYIEKPFDTEELKSLLSEALRVSREVSKIEVTTLPGSENIASDHVLDNNLSEALQVINRLKALRYAGGEQQGDNKEARRRVVEMFISEAIPQLVFCDSAIKNLSNQDQIAFELGYLFRVMQTIAVAAASVNEDKVAEFAKAAEYFYTSLRVQPKSAHGELITLAADANEVLRLAVSMIGEDALPERFSEILERLKAETSHLSGLVAA